VSLGVGLSVLEKWGGTRESPEEIFQGSGEAEGAGLLWTGEVEPQGYAIVVCN